MVSYITILVSLNVTKVSLNPCCSERWSRTSNNMSLRNAMASLNPCCSGRWSRTVELQKTYNMQSAVLILVVVEDGLVLTMVTLLLMLLAKVLILVVVEDGLVLLLGATLSVVIGLNPCCSGRWSRTCKRLAVC